jgi:hypothetical protein
MIDRKGFCKPSRFRSTRSASCRHSESGEKRTCTKTECRMRNLFSLCFELIPIEISRPALKYLKIVSFYRTRNDGLRKNSTNQPFNPSNSQPRHPITASHKAALSVRQILSSRSYLLFLRSHVPVADQFLLPLRRGLLPHLYPDQHHGLL